LAFCRSILTGLYPATSGSATINGLDVATQIAQIRRSLGFCPQHNVLFNNLSVVEQLRFYAGLKGVREGADMKREIDLFLRDVGLESKRHVVASKLSGWWANERGTVHILFRRYAT
jgi:ABC-type multidrug transport system ATPase subunit